MSTERKVQAPEPIPKDVFIDLLNLIRGYGPENSLPEINKIVSKYPNILITRDIYQFKELGNTPLLLAIALNKTELARKLMELDKSGKSLAVPDTSTNSKNSPLLLALKTGNITVAKELIKRLSPEDLRCKDHFGFTPMLWAAMLRLDDIVAMLVLKDVDPHEKMSRCDFRTCHRNAKKRGPKISACM